MFSDTECSDEVFTDYIVKHRWTGTEESGSKNCPMVSFDDDVSVLGNAIIHESFESSAEP